jgi:hypothetical protein
VGAPAAKQVSATVGSMDKDSQYKIVPASRTKMYQLVCISSGQMVATYMMHIYTSINQHSEISKKKINQHSGFHFILEKKRVKRLFVRVQDQARAKIYFHLLLAYKSTTL